MKAFRLEFLAAIILSLALISCSNPAVDKTKNSILPNKDIKVGEAFDKYKYFKSKSWERLDTDADQKIVQFRGRLQWDGQNFGKTDMIYDSAYFIVQFTIYPDNSIKISKIDLERNLVRYGKRMDPLDDKQNIIFDAIYRNTDIFSEMM